jgi:hypothetical protein
MILRCDAETSWNPEGGRVLAQSFIREMRRPPEMQTPPDTKENEKETRPSWYLCTECREYVLDSHEHSVVQKKNPFSPKPKPPYCPGCGTVIPKQGIVCQTCRLKVESLLSRATYNGDLLDACKDYISRCADAIAARKAARKRKRNGESDGDEEDEDVDVDVDVEEQDDQDDDAEL